MIRSIRSSLYRFFHSSVIKQLLIFILLLCACTVKLTQPPEIATVITPTLPTVVPSAAPVAAAGTGALGQRPYHLEVSLPAGQIAQSERVDYLLYLPDTYGADLAYRWPLILYLHGSGECGVDLNLLLNQPLPKYLAVQADFPFIVVSPQVPCLVWQKDSYSDYSSLAWTWADHWNALRVLLDELQITYAVDLKRVYLTGISMGGFGVWQIALECPDCFAAIVPIAGGYLYQSDQVPANICDLQSLPVWTFHGGQDVNVSYSQTQVLVDALQECGGDVRFTLYPDLGHNAWDRAYADPELIQWLLAQHKP